MNWVTDRVVIVYRYSVNSLTGINGHETSGAAIYVYKTSRYVSNGHYAPPMIRKVMKYNYACSILLTLDIIFIKENTSRSQHPFHIKMLQFISQAIHL